MDQMTLAFDYDALAPEDRAVVLDCRDEIRSHVTEGVASIYAVGRTLLLAKGRLKRATGRPGTFVAWVSAEFGWSKTTAYRYMAVATHFGDEFPTVGNSLSPAVLYALAAGKPIPVNSNGTHEMERDDDADEPDDADPDTPAPIAGALDLAAIRGKFTVAEWNALDAPTRQLLIDEAPAYGGSRTHFNRTNDNVDWARWTWNPVTGCLHDCPYCYARDIAARFYDQGFAPTFLPERLHAPRYSVVPPNALTDDRESRVFVGSMADLFGKWVPQDWIDAVFAEVVRAPQWRFLFLTKFPRKLAEQDWPANAWVGTSVDRQFRVEIAEKSFRDVRAGVKWLSCEPMLERLTFTSLEMFDWVVIGGESSNSHNRAGFDPPWEWIEHLLVQARAAGCRVYFKENLRNAPKELPVLIDDVGRR